ncbi:hypothetical protein Hte_007024 [Hypoxylon texense]
MRSRGNTRIHIDVKPENFLVNWTSDKQGNKTATDAVLGDFDIAFKPEGGTPLNTRFAIGNAIWRNPEGQTGRGVTRASDVFLFGLVCIYTLGAGELLLLNNYQELVQNCILPERWGAEFGPEAQSVISGMTNPDPTARLTIDEVLAHAWCQEDV